MSKLVKDMMIRDLHGRYGELESAVWVEMVGADGNTTNAFRGDLHKHDMKIEIVKTALFRRAVAEGKLAPLGNELTGPSAIVYGGESAIDISKVLDPWIDKIDGLKVRGAVLEGEYLNEQQCETLSKMPTKRDLQGKVLSIALAPGANLMGAVAGPGRMVLGCVKAMIGKLEDGEEITKVA